MNIQASPSDIRARGSFDGTSMVPERREAQRVSEYMSHMAQVAALFSRWETDENRDQMAEDLANYRAGYSARMNAYLASHSRIVSQFITGAGGWDGRQVRSNNKKIDSADNRLRELIEWSEKRLGQLSSRYDPLAIARRPIRTGDADALERLAEKIARLEYLQERMKDANKIVRSAKLNNDEKIDALMTIEGITESRARELLKPDFMGRLGFPAYALTNNSANIRRLKERYEQIERRQAVDAAIGERRWDFEGGYVLENPDADRYQVFHDSKPAREKIDALKAHGLRWTPSAGCWQAYRSPSGKYAVEAVTGISL